MRAFRHSFFTQQPITDRLPSFKTESDRKTEAVLSPSVAFGDSSLPEGAFDCAYFFLCATKKTKGIFRTSKPKIRTLFLLRQCSHVAVSLFGRKVSRESVTEGARGSERWHILLFCTAIGHRIGCPLFKRGAVSRTAD